MAVYLSPQRFAVMSIFLKHSFFLQMLIQEIGCLLEKRSLAHHVSIYSVWLRCMFHCFVMTAVFILFMIGVYPFFQNYPNFLNQSCHSYVVQLHDEVFFKKIDLEVSDTQIYFFEIDLEGKTLFY